MAAVKLRVAVCGGGIGGLVLARALAKSPDISVGIYEAASQFSAFGAGIGMFPRAWDVISALGLDVDLAKITAPPPVGKERTHALTFRKSDQPNGFVIREMYTQGRFSMFHRAEFQQELLKHIPSCSPIYYAKRLQSYTQHKDIESSPVHLHFEDGSTATCDVLVGADGVNSAVRKSLLHERAEVSRTLGQHQESQHLLDCIDPLWSGSIAYRSLIPLKRLQEDCETRSITPPDVPVMYLGKGVHMIVYPVSHGRMINLALFHTRPELAGTVYQRPWRRASDATEIAGITRFEDWEPDARFWIKCIRNPTKWAIHTIKPLPTFVSGRVVLLGDAAHAYSPHQGSGAGQAIEDAYILAELLAHQRTTPSTASRALQVYDAVRRPWSHKLGARALANGRYFALNYDNFDFNTKRVSPVEIEAKLKEMCDVIVEKWKWCWTSSVKDSLDEALRLLEER